MKTYGEVDVYIHVLLTSALVGGQWLALRPKNFTTPVLVGSDAGQASESVWTLPLPGIEHRPTELHC
jgi:hypothetical protein